MKQYQQKIIIQYIMLQINFKYIFQLIVFILSFTIVFSCTKFIMLNDINTIYNKKQLDSITYVEKIDSNLNNWHPIHLIDYETNDSIYKWFYIKSLDDNEIIYNILLINDSLYKFNKRITRIEK